MSMAEDRLEILIGKLLDGELSPAERRILDRELEQDGRARELLEQLRLLHECGREAVAQELSEGAAGPDEIFERAWRQSRSPVRHRIARIDGRLRFAVGLAAGFILGLAVQLVLMGGGQPSMSIPMESPVARGLSTNAGERDGTWPALERSGPPQITREVEWYSFTDQAGNHWLIEGLREGRTKPAVYYGDL